MVMCRWMHTTVNALSDSNLQPSKTRFSIAKIAAGCEVQRIASVQSSWATIPEIRTFGLTFHVMRHAVDVRTCHAQHLYLTSSTK